MERRYTFAVVTQIGRKGIIHVELSQGLPFPDDCEAWVVAVNRAIRQFDGPPQAIRLVAKARRIDGEWNVVETWDDSGSASYYGSQIPTVSGIGPVENVADHGAASWPNYQKYNK
jgi:hypothetical protein